MQILFYSTKIAKSGDLSFTKAKLKIWSVPVFTLSIAKLQILSTPDLTFCKRKIEI